MRLNGFVVWKLHFLSLFASTLFVCKLNVDCLSFLHQHFSCLLNNQMLGCLPRKVHLTNLFLFGYIESVTNSIEHLLFGPGLGPRDLAKKLVDWPPHGLQSAQHSPMG